MAKLTFDLCFPRASATKYAYKSTDTQFNLGDTGPYVMLQVQSQLVEVDSKLSDNAL